jgi:type III secretion protein W
MHDPIVSRSFPMNVIAAKELQELANQEEMMVIESDQSFTDYNDTNLLALFRGFRTLEEIKKGQVTQRETKDLDTEMKIFTVQEAEDSANRYEANNYELRSRSLLNLRTSISNKDSKEEALNKVLRMYPDHALADEALDFLAETTQGDTLKTIQLAKELLNQNFKREVLSGRNIATQAREFAKEGLGAPTSLRDLYRDITGTARDPLQLFQELTEKFRYDKLATAIKFLLHSLGADLRAKGASISRAELKRLIDETRSLQGIMGVFRFFQSRMRLMQRQFVSYSLVFPPRLNFEVLARLFVKIIAERYISADKVLQFSQALGLSEESAAQLIIFTQYRDAIRQIAPRYYRNQQHREDLLKAVIEALENLEDELEEEEKQEKKK